MRKIIVISISIILIAFFGALTWYGLMHARGIPVAIEKEERVILEVPFIDKEIDLKEAISPNFWDAIPSKGIDLKYQVMVLQWPKVVVPSISVKAFHNKKEIYFHISWKDDTQDDDLKINKFSDACAIMFPLGDEVQPSTIMMGFIGTANIWQWKASQDKEYWLGKHPETEAYADFHYPFEEKELFPISKEIPKSAANDLISIRVGTITPKELQNVEAKGVWNDGQWHVVFKRSLKAIDPEIDAVFNIGKKQLCAFAAWNGSKGDRAGRKSISDWVELIVH